MRMANRQRDSSGGSNTNKVVFVEDLESGGETCTDHNNNDEKNSAEFSSNTFSIVGPLPSTDNTPTGSHSSSNSVGSNIVNSTGISGTSILKKNSKRKGEGPYERRSSTGPNSTSVHSGCTGSSSHYSRSTQSTGASSGSGYYTPSAKATPRPIWYGRWLFFVLLLMVAAALGYLTYTSLTDNETFLATCVFVKVAEHAISTINNNQDRKKLGMNTMGSVIGASGYDRDQWPYVTLNDFESIARNVIDVSRGCNIAFGPLVTPVQAPGYEAFAADFYQNSRIPEPFPNGTGVNVDDRVGVWAMDSETKTPFHDVSGATAWNSSRRILVPMIQQVSGPSKKLMFNLHSSPLLGKNIEDMMTCAEETKELIRKHGLEQQQNTFVKEGEEEEPQEPLPVPSLQDCTMVTDIAFNKTSWVQKEPMGPGANMLQPVFPANSKTEIVGVLVTQIVWTENMRSVFSANVDGIDVILSTPTQTVSYTVMKGVVTYTGEGDFHDSKYDHMKHEGFVTTPGNFANQSVPYTIALYPSDTLYEMYATNNPLNAAVGAICVMLFTVLMFLAYDFLVRREFSAKNELLKAKRHFMRYVSHEVRTPLNSVCMGLNLMQEEIQSKLSVTGKSGEDSAMITIDEASAWLNLSRDVHVSAQSATNVLNDFLNYDKIESRQLTLELSIIPIQSLITATASEFVLPAQDKAIQLSVVQERIDASDAATSNGTAAVAKAKNKNKATKKKQVEVDVIDDIESQLLQDQVVVGDKARLSQVVRNVISNAIKFTPKKGSITVKSTWIVATVGESTNINLQDGQTEALHQTGWIQIEVTDTGPGMTEEQLQTVFQSGVQFNANKNQKGGGSGLGLFIAKGIVDQHNGTLTVDSEGMGKGCSFMCKLPVYCKPKETKIDNVSVTPRDDTITERVSSCWLDEHSEHDLNYRILVVDDAPMNRKLLTRLLMKRGHHVDMAEDGLEAYEKVVASMKEDRRYDTILMDFQMPVMDGPTATQRIRTEGCDSFIVGITGNVLPQDVEHFKACGADGVIGKPFHVEELESLWIEYGVTSG